MRSRGLRVLFVVGLAVGAILGTLEIALVAFADENGARSLSGLLIAALAIASTVVDVSPFSTNGALVVANFLLEPATQARAQDPKNMGSFTVLDLDTLAADERRLFDSPPEAIGLPANAELGRSLPEPHPSWMTRITEEWERRAGR